MTSLSFARHLKFYRLYFLRTAYLVASPIVGRSFFELSILLVPSGVVQYHGASATERIRSASKAMPAVVAPWPINFGGCEEVSETRDLAMDSTRIPGFTKRRDLGSFGVAMYPMFYWNHLKT